MLGLLADLLSHQLSTEEEMFANEQALLGERRTAELREQFMAVLGHDLRNPLHAILLASNMLLEGGPQVADPESFYKRIRRSAHRISEMVEELLDFARGRLGDGIPVEPRPIKSVRRLLDRVVDELSGRFPDHEVTVDSRGPLEVHWDPGRMAQVFSNLLGNALQHGATGTPVRIELHGEGPDVTVAVTNHGPPIPPHFLPRLFEPFHRGNELHTGSRSGLGLGLYIAHQIVQAHGGTLAVQSDSDGTVFTLRVPRQAG